MNGSDGRNLLAPRRACSTHARVARVSRLIGNSDTTAKPYPWQVDVCGRDATCGVRGKQNNSRNGKEPSPKRRKRHSIGVASQHFRIRHWPPRQMESGGCLHRSDSGFPAGFSLLRAARWRLLLPGARSLLWLAGRSLQQPIHHWHHYIAIDCSVLNTVYFQ